MIVVESGTIAFGDGSPTIAAYAEGSFVPSFLIDQFEVTNAQYGAFLGSTGYPEPSHWNELTPEHDELPVVNVTWLDAIAYAEWAGKRLPGYLEWLLAARGEEGRKFPWGNDLPMRGVVGRGSMPLSTKEAKAGYFEHARKVGSDPTAATKTGIHDLFGNVAEWTETPASQPKLRDGHRVFEPLDPHTRLIAGSYWAAGQGLVPPDLVHPIIHLDGPVAAGFTTGFRCVRDIP